MTNGRRPWAALPAAVAIPLRAALPGTVDAVVAAIGADVPAYRQQVDGAFGVALRRGVEIALGRQLSLLGTDEPALDARAAVAYRRIGAGEYAAGRALETLLAAYRIGARVAWDHHARAATAAGVSTDELVLLAEVVFVYIDELSAASVDGFAAEQAARAGYRDVRRSRLAAALIAGELATDPERVRTLADEAGWPLPARAAVALLPRPAHRGRDDLPSAPPDALVLEQEAEVIAVLPDPSGPGRRERLAAGLTTGEVYVGTVRPPEEAGLSLDHARRLRRLVAAGLVPSAPVVVATDHLVELVVAADPLLLGELTARALRPLAGLPPSRRMLLLSTLRAWLDHDGDRQAVAEALVVHPQTVSYRMGRLRELLGGALDDPRARMSLRLATAATPTPHPPSSATTGAGSGATRRG